MAESSDIKNAAQNLGEQTQKINQAIKYTDGNMDLARKMVAGDYKDAYIIKMKIRSDLTRDFGVVLLIVGKGHMRTKNAFVAMSRSPYVYDKKTSVGWKFFYKEIIEFHSDQDYEPETSNKIDNFLKKKIQGAVGSAIIQAIDDKNTQQVTEILEKLLKAELQITKAQLQLDFETTTSLALEENDIADVNAQVAAPASKTESKEEDFGPEIKRILADSLQGSCVLSPTKGKELTRLKLGDKIKVHVTDPSERGRNIIKILNAETDEGSLKPVPARVRFIRKMNNGNWLVIVDLGDNIFIRIEEEADNVRVAMVDAPGTDASSSQTPKNASSMPLIIGLGVGVFVLLFTIIIFLFL